MPVSGQQNRPGFEAGSTSSHPNCSLRQSRTLVRTPPAFLQVERGALAASGPDHWPHLTKSRSFTPPRRRRQDHFSAIQCNLHWLRTTDQNWVVAAERDAATKTRDRTRMMRGEGRNKKAARGSGRRRRGSGRWRGLLKLCSHSALQLDSPGSFPVLDNPPLLSARPLVRPLSSSRSRRPSYTSAAPQQAL